MSSAQFNALIDAIRDDDSVAARIATVTTAEQAVEIAAGLGFDITTDDLKPAAGGRRASGELSEQELAGVSGGDGSALSWGVIYCGGGPPGSWGVINCSG